MQKENSPFLHKIKYIDQIVKDQKESVCVFLWPEDIFNGWEFWGKLLGKDTGFNSWVTIWLKDWNHDVYGEWEDRPTLQILMLPS